MDIPSQQLIAQIKETLSCYNHGLKSTIKMLSMMKRLDPDAQVLTSDHMKELEVECLRLQVNTHRLAMDLTQYQEAPGYYQPQRPQASATSFPSTVSSDIDNYTMTRHLNLQRSMDNNNNRTKWNDFPSLRARSETRIYQQGEVDVITIYPQNVENNEGDVPMVAENYQRAPNLTEPMVTRSRVAACSAASALNKSKEPRSAGSRSKRGRGRPMS